MGFDDAISDFPLLPFLNNDNLEVWKVPSVGFHEQSDIALSFHKPEGEAFLVTVSVKHFRQGFHKGYE